MTADRDIERCLPYARPRSNSQLRLFCLPYAGGGATIYRDWADELPAWVDVLPVQLPGREHRADEEPLRSIARLADQLVDELEPHIQDMPFALFGHSMGALLAYELTVRLERGPTTGPAVLLVAGHRPPHTPDHLPPLYELPDDQFLKAIFALDGTPQELMRDTEIVHAVLPLLRADFTAVDTYVHQESQAVRCPVTVFTGAADPTVEVDRLGGWSELCEITARVRRLPGGHFFLNTHRSLLCGMVATELHRATRDIRRPVRA